MATSMAAGTVLADHTTNQAPKHKQKVEERTVFVTGSLIPQRIKLQPIGTTTVSPLRIIDRHEIDWTGRPKTPGALINDGALIRGPGVVCRPGRSISWRSNIRSGQNRGVAIGLRFKRFGVSVAVAKR